MHHIKCFLLFLYVVLDDIYSWNRWHAVAQLVEAASRKVAGSITDGVIGIFRWHNPSDHTMTLRLTQSLTEMSK